jgi:RNA polymerase sigma-70 factor (ECF subfamily)
MIKGDEQAFDLFVDEYYPRLYRFAFSRLQSDPEVAQDVVQATFAKVIRKLAAYRGEAALFSWLCAFCRFEIAAHWRWRGRTAPEIQLAEDAPGVRAALESLAASQEGPDEQAARRELARLVRVALDHLPFHYCNALEWKYIHDLPVVEVAARLGVGPKAAESLLTRARQAFRDGFTAILGGMQP